MARDICGCVGASFPNDASAVAEASLLDSWGTPPNEATLKPEYWKGKRNEIRECLVRSCAGERCEFDAGYTAAHDHDYDAAIEHYTRYITSHPELSTPLVNRGRSYLDSGRYEQAIADFTRAIELAPKYADAWRYLAMAYHNAGRDLEALSAADEDITLDTSPAVAYAIRGNIEETLGKRDEAIADYRKVLILTLNAEELTKAREALQHLGATP